MSIKIEPNNRDALAELFRKKLEDHQVSVDSHSWSKLKKQLGGNGKLTLWLAFAAASAAVIALLFILSPSDEAPVDYPSQVKSPTTVIDDHDGMSITEEGVVVFPSQIQDADMITDSKESAKGKVISEPLKQESKSAQPSLADRKLSDNEVIKQEVTQEEPILLAATPGNSGRKAVGEEIGEAEEQANATQNTEAKQEVKQSLYFTEFLDDSSEKKSTNRWTLAAHYNGSAGANSDMNYMQTPIRSDVFNNYEGSMEIIRQTAIREYTEEKHFPEISASFTVGKQLNNRVTVESGLTYSYLQSKFEWKDALFSYDQKQSLHYIGIPVNVIVYALKGNSKWNLYASGGGMLEKGIQATYKETAKDGLGKSTTTYTSKSISGVQWSLSASVGATYNLNKSLSLYVAPRLSYYFDNDQPESVRTSKDLAFGAVVGLRYNL